MPAVMQLALNHTLLRRVHQLHRLIAICKVLAVMHEQPLKQRRILAVTLTAHVKQQIQQYAPPMLREKPLVSLSRVQSGETYIHALKSAWEIMRLEDS